MHISESGFLVCQIEIYQTDKIIFSFHFRTSEVDSTGKFVVFQAVSGSWRKHPDPVKFFTNYFLKK